PGRFLRRRGVAGGVGDVVLSAQDDDVDPVHVHLLDETRVGQGAAFCLRYRHRRCPASPGGSPSWPTNALTSRRSPSSLSMARLRRSPFLTCPAWSRPSRTASAAAARQDCRRSSSATAPAPTNRR